jgi:hypothetical protein
VYKELEAGEKKEDLLSEIRKGKRSSIQRGEKGQ